VLISATVLPTTAFAQVHDPVAATELFAKGRAAMKEKDYATACAAFAESARLDSKVGTLLNLADCEERIAHFASARAHWQQAADLAHAQGDAREGVALKHFLALDPRVAKLTVRLASDAPPGTTVRRDGVEVGAGSLGVALPVDPGAHELVVSATGYEDKKVPVMLKEGEAQEVSVGPGEKHPAPPPPTPVAPPPVPAPPPSTWNAQKTLALTAAGVGVAGVVVGSVFGLKAKSANSSSMNNASSSGCSPDNTCGPIGLGLRDTAVRDGNISTIGFAAGGGMLALGTILWLTARSSSLPSAGATRALRIVARPTGAALQGAW
jgi:hypothetical protein